MNKYDMGYNRAQKGLCRPNSDSWELEEEFSEEFKSGQKTETVIVDGYNNSTLRVDE